MSEPSLTEAERMALARAQVEAIKTEHSAHVVTAVELILADRLRDLRGELTLANLACDDKEEFIAGVRAKLSHTEAERDDAHVAVDRERAAWATKIELVALNLDRGDSIDRGIAADLRGLLAADDTEAKP